MVNERDYNVGRDLYGSGYLLHYDNGDFSLERYAPTITFSEGDRIHTVVDGETLQSIAYKYYGDSGYWYQIAEANGIVNPFSDKEFYVHQQLTIPLYGII